MKNVSKKSQRLKYKLPATKYFSMEFPEPINLSPGMSQTVTITFRPIRIEQYDDFIEFVSIPHGAGISGGNSFFVPVRAKLPVVSLNVPSALEFGYCAVKEKITKEFVLTNDGDLACSYNWKVSEPFALEPPTGELAPGESQTVTVSFNPMEVSVYVANAVCIVANNGYSVGCSIKGVGKFPFITLSKNDVDFGDAYVGKSSVHSVRLFNHSLVPATFSTSWIDKDSTRAGSTASRAFTVSPKHGVLAPDSFLDFRITYTPTTTGTFSSDSIAIATKGGNTVALNVVGNAIGPDVSFNVSSINFGNVRLGDGVGRVLYLENSSEIGIKFALLAERSGKVYSFDKTKGEVEPYTSTFINVNFTPNTPSNYFKRIVCLVSNRAPLFVDLLGTGFSEKRHPPPLLAQHIDAYYQRIKLGLPLFPKNTSHDDEEERVVQQKLLEAKQSDGEKNTFLTELESWERVFKGVDPASAVVLENDELDFGGCSRLKLPEYKTLTVRNNTRVKITCFWAAPSTDTSLLSAFPAATAAASSSGGSAGKQSESVFHVFPEESDIAPGGSTSFRVSFRPSKDRTYYSSTLECFAYVKTMRNFRLVNDMNKVCAPWNLSATAWGHTYGAGDDEFMPKASFSSRRIHFSGCHKGERTFLTTSLVNHGDTPVRFEFLRDASSASRGSVYELRPRCGVIGAKDFSIIAMSFAPTQAKEYLETIRCSLNNGKSTVDLQVVGVGYVPEISVLPTSSVSFKPTCLGSVTRRKVSLYNRSAITVIYEWDLGAAKTSCKNVFKVEPMCGTIRGNETVDVEWLFTPNKTKHYHGRVRCLFKPAHCEQHHSGGAGGSGDVSSVDVRLHGEGTVGVVTFDPPLVDFGAIGVGLSTKKQLTMYNHSSGNVNYQLRVTDFSEELNGCTDETTSASQKSATEFIKVDQLSSMIPARSSKTINIDLMPEYSRALKYKLSMTTSELARASVDLHDAMAMKCPSVDVTATAQYAMLCITNAYSNSLAKSYLWRQLELNELNVALSQPLSHNELLLNINNIATPIQANKSDKGKDVTEAVFNLGANLVGSTTTVILLEFTNVSKVTLDWQFIFQNDQEVEMENWVDVPEPQSEYEAAQNFIAENKIFEVSPKLMKMEPGARCTVEMRYKHDFVGFHEMPMLLKVERGKRIRMRLRGNTRGFHERSLQLLGMQQTLSPVCIGERHPPSQSLLLRNDGPTPVHYSFDLSELEKLKRDHYNFDVLKVLNARGSIAPGANAHVNVVFRPLEAITYGVTLGLNIKDGPTYHVALSGNGVDRIPSEEDETDAAVAGTTTMDAADMHGRMSRPSSSSQTNPKRSVQQVPVSMRSVLDLAGFTPFQSLRIPNSFATLSHDHVDFGSSIPARAQVRRCILLTNVLATHALHFHWSTGAFGSGMVSGVMTVEPQHGRVEPLASVLVKLTYDASALPSQMDTDITCRVLPEVGEEQMLDDDVEDLDDDVGASTFSRNNHSAAAVKRKGKVYRKSLENRKSVVDSSTISMRNKFPRLGAAGAAAAAATAADESKRSAKMKEAAMQSTDTGIDVDWNNENIDTINNTSVDASSSPAELRSVIIGQSNSTNSNTNKNDNFCVDDSDEKTMTMTLNLGISGATVHQSSLSPHELAHYFVPTRPRPSGGRGQQSGTSDVDDNVDTSARAMATRDMNEIVFEAIQDVIIDCIGDTDVREALEGGSSISSGLGRSGIIGREESREGASATLSSTGGGGPFFSQIRGMNYDGASSSSTVRCDDVHSDESERRAPVNAVADAQADTSVLVESGDVRKELDRQKLLESEDFRSLAAFVLDNAIFGLLQESAADQWS